MFTHSGAEPCDDGADGNVFRLQLRAVSFAAHLAEAKAQNISILSYLANHFNTPMMAWLAPIVAMVAITKSFLGHYLGAREGFNGLIIKSLRSRGKSISENKLNRLTALFMLVTTGWWRHGTQAFLV